MKNYITMIGVLDTYFLLSVSISGGHRQQMLATITLEGVGTELLALACSMRAKRRPILQLQPVQQVGEDDNPINKDATCN